MKLLLKNLFKNSLQKGFTLIELLVVIAVLGVLATIVLLAVNPGEQLARARDTSRIAAVTQLGRGLQAYYTAAGGSFSGIPQNTAGTAAFDWMSPMVVSQDLKVRPANPGWGGTVPTGPSDCTASPNYKEANSATVPVAATINNGNAGGYCYRTDLSSNAISYVRLESNLYNNKCTAFTPSVAWGVFSTADARFGVTCGAEPTVGTQSFQTTP